MADSDLDQLAARIRGVEAEIAARCAALENLSKPVKVDLTQRIKHQRQGLATLSSQDVGKGVTERAEEELVALIKKLHFAGFARKMVIGRPGGVFVGVRDVWLEALHAHCTLRVSHGTEYPSIVLELDAPRRGATDGAVLSAHIGALRVWGDAGTRVPTINIRKGARVQLRVKMVAELSFVPKALAKQQPKAAAASARGSGGPAPRAPPHVVAPHG